MTAPDVLAALAGSRRDLYYDALIKLRDLDRDSAGLSFAIATAEEMARRGEISEREQADRFSAILTTIGIAPESQATFARDASKLPRHLKNAVALVLPVELRPLLDDKTSLHSAPTSPGALPEPPPSKTANAPVEDQGVLCTVFVLSREDNQVFDRNRIFLKNNGFAALRLDTHDSLMVTLKDSWDVSGCIIDRTFLASLKADEQRSFLAELARFSSFLWIRIQEEGLLLNNLAIQDLVKKARCQHTSISVNQLSVQKGGELSEFELDSLKLSRDMLHTEDTARFIRRYRE